MIKKKLIIIDDDEGIQDIFRLIFQRTTYEFKIFSGAEIIFESDFDPPDLFILDKHISGKDGLVVCKHLKSQDSTRHIPVIIVSATPGIKELSIEAGAEDYIEKPFELKTLLNLVEKWI